MGAFDDGYASQARSGGTRCLAGAHWGNLLHLRTRAARPTGKHPALMPGGVCRSSNQPTLCTLRPRPTSGELATWGLSALGGGVVELCGPGCGNLPVFYLFCAGRACPIVPHVADDAAAQEKADVASAMVAERRVRSEPSLACTMSSMDQNSQFSRAKCTDCSGRR